MAQINIDDVQKGALALIERAGPQLFNIGHNQFMRASPNVFFKLQPFLISRVEQNPQRGVGLLQVLRAVLNRALKLIAGLAQLFFKLLALGNVAQGAYSGFSR